MPVLTADELEAALAGLPGWQVVDGKLCKIYTTASFMAALDLVNRVGEVAEAANHHPDIAINYNRVTFSLITHDEGGITQKDVDLASQIEAVAS
ncbi:MAG TPA: 4a-hydroxytetrahydrobiopterin dehydratase [Chloroflexota bacterium]|jgi:4a-hydroxytetrahydrobiopterin dehydratase|nr:4a-hydroxytetrahydrobiopterin dehydratase [Chloroflexota bacterium]